MQGKVYLVGAGPGNIKHITLKAKELLTEAEVLIYDALVDEKLLDLVTDNCLKIDVGKRGGKKSTPQGEINRLLVEYCLKGKQVVRLKSGDPLIFGRSTEEILALTNAGCDFELIPGISSVFAAPLLAGIPLTDKVLSGCFAVLSGHHPQSIDWETLAKIDTLVILMGGSTLGEIVRELGKKGRSLSTPVAIICNCSRPEQKIFWGTLKDIIEKTVGVSLSPAVIVIGEVVSLSSKNISSDEDKVSQKLTDFIGLEEKKGSMLGKTILVTRAAGQSSKFTELLVAEGAKVIEMPALVITPPSSWEGLDGAIASIATFHWLILTSANGVEYFFERFQVLKQDIRSLAGIKIAVVGKKTAITLQKYSLQPDFIPPDFIADSMVANFPEPLTQKKILFPRVESGGRDVLVKELTAQGAEVIEVAAYESGCPPEIEPNVWEALQKKEINIVTFASSKTVKNFYQLITAKGEKVENILENVAIASIGPETSSTCHQLLGRVDIEAKEYTLEGLTDAIIEKSLN